MSRRPMGRLRALAFVVAVLVAGLLSALPGAGSPPAPEPEPDEQAWCILWGLICGGNHGTTRERVCIEVDPAWVTTDYGSGAPGFSCRITF